MNWNNLLGKCCPSCGGDLLPRRPGFKCVKEECEFFIRAERLQELIPVLRRQYFGAKLANQRSYRSKQAQLITSE